MRSSAYSVRCNKNGYGKKYNIVSSKIRRVGALIHLKVKLTRLAISFDEKGDWCDDGKDTENGNSAVAGWTEP